MEKILVIQPKECPLMKLVIEGEEPDWIHDKLEPLTDQEVEQAFRNLMTPN